MSTPLYLAEPDTSGYLYGTLSFDMPKECYVVEAEPAVLEMAKRVFPGSREWDRGRLRFPATRRAVGDLNWLMQRFPLRIACPDRFQADREKAIAHAFRRDSNLVLAAAVPPPTFQGKLFSFQAAGVSFLVANERALLADDMGLGKAQPLGAKILTPTGWTTMGQLHVGDTVIGSNGRPTEVIGVFPQGERPIYRVTFTDGSSTECDENHLWAVRTPNQRKRKSAYRIKSLREIIATGLVDRQGNHQHFVPMVPAVDFPEGDFPIDPYLLGVLLGNGGLTTKSVEFSTADDEMLVAVGECLPAGVSVKSTASDPVTFRITADRSGHRTNSLLTSLRQLGLMGKGSHEKSVPHIYKFASALTRLSVLQGLLDTDGHVRPADNHIEYCTTSADLAQDVRFLVQSLGGIAIIHEKLPKFTYRGEQKIGRLAYVLSIAMPAGVKPFRLSRKADTYHPRWKYPPYRAISSIEYIGIKPAQCIKIAAPDELYITDDFIVTHNTITALGALATVAAFPSIIVVPNNVRLQWQRQAGTFLDLPTAGQQSFDLENDDRGKRLCHIITGRKPYTLPKQPLYIIPYHLLQDWRDPLLEVGSKAIIFDEIQELRHTGTQKYSAASLLSGSARYVWGLSGTPIYNYGDEIWSITNILDFNCLGDHESFTREWCDGYEGHRVIKPDVLGDYLRREGLMIRRRKSDVQAELPPKRRAVVVVDHDKDKYSNLVSEAAALAAGYGNIKDWHEKGLVKREIEGAARQAAGISKAPFVADFVRGLLEAGERVLLFAYHHAVHDLLEERLITFNPVRVTGHETPTQKDAAVTAFSEGQTNLIQLALRSTAGLDKLQGRGTCVVFAELDWSPSIHSQCEDRLHRIGVDSSLDSILCYYLVSDTGMDETMQEALGLKVGQFIGLMGDKSETEEDKALADQAAERHMDRVIEKLKALHK